MKSLRTVLLLAGLLLGGHFTGLGQRATWAVVASNIPSRTAIQPGNGSYPVSSVTDLQGNTYTWQTIGGPTRIGTANLTTTPNRFDPVTGQVLAWNQDVCLAKFRPSGRLAWVRQGGGNYVNQAMALAVDERGSVFVAGFNWSRFRFGTQTIADSGYFLSRVDTSGNVRWASHLAAYPNTLPRGMYLAKLQTDGLGNCLLVGHNYNNPTLGNLPLAVTGRYDTFIAKFNAAGTGQWVREIFSSSRALNGPSLAPEIAADGAGNWTLTAATTDTITIGVGGPVLVSNPANPFNTFTIRYDRQGQVLWTRRGRSSGASSIRTDDLGNTYLVGGTNGNGANFGAFSLGFNAAGFVLKYDPAGTEQWLFSTQNGSGNYVTTDPAGNVYVGGGFNGAMQLGPLTLPQARGFRDGFLLSLTPAGTPRWLYGFGSGSINDYVNGLGVDQAQNIYATVSSDSATYLGGRPVPGSVGGTVLARLTQRANRLAGVVYLDRNNNGRRDSTEAPFPRPMILTNPVDGQFFSNETQLTGAFQAFADSGAWAVQPAVLPLYHTLRQPTPGRYRGRFVGYGQVADTLNFGLVAVPNQTDIRATLTPYGAVRPGFTARYRLTLENVGTTAVASGTASVTLDGRGAYISSAPSGTRAGQTISWTYANLASFARREFDVLFSLPVNTALGTVLSSTAAAPLAADVVPADNSSTATQTVTGSFDPNDITVNYQRLSPAQVAAGQPLDYTIRFQNMGTDTAFTVVIKDTLNFRKLNLGSLMLVAQSHNCLWSLSGQGELTVRFLNIRLPHRGIDVIRSQGFVRFRVLPKPSLAVGDIIPNHASIVFDYNAPIRTNTATTAVLLPTAALRPRPELAWDAYPNPATGPLTIAAELPAAGPVSLLLLDALGRPVRQQRLLAPAGPLRETLDVQSLTPGLYVLRLTLPDGTASSRVVVRE